ncbi:DUF3168 domain-containing protein [Variovorax sp. GT1P44]|uniref:DUF3168 domain-containing protein n=1 Tax=Variovorax sp. GT1P44 TaxID=3443742 RepID=UPI003F46C840
MTVEADLFNTLKGLVPTNTDGTRRVYADVAPDGVVAPYIVYQQIGGRAVAFIERSMTSKKNGRFQIAVWSTTRAEAAAIGLQIESAMLTSALFQTEAIGAQEADYDAETKLRGSRQHFGIWSDR